MEAEAIKLFANSYLAMRVSYFNELDTFCELNNLNSKEVIIGMGYDSRIGDYYNNPSFGYGGYCLPKDTKQLLAGYNDIPQHLIGAIVSANETRMDFIASQIAAKNPKRVGIYRLAMKMNSDNYRTAAIHGIIMRLKKYEISLSLYDPEITENFFDAIPVNKKLKDFIEDADIIVANRMHDDLQEVAHKVYTRDIFNQD